MRVRAKGCTLTFALTHGMSFFHCECRFFSATRFLSKSNDLPFTSVSTFTPVTLSLTRVAITIDMKSNGREEEAYVLLGISR